MFCNNINAENYVTNETHIWWSPNILDSRKVRFQELQAIGSSFETQSALLSDQHKYISLLE